MIARIVGPLGAMIPEVGPSAPISFAVTLDEDECRVEGLVPLRTIKSVVSGVQKLQQNMQKMTLQKAASAN